MQALVVVLPLVLAPAEAAIFLFSNQQRFYQVINIVSRRDLVRSINLEMITAIFTPCM